MCHFKTPTILDEVNFALLLLLSLDNFVAAKNSKTVEKMYCYTQHSSTIQYTHRFVSDVNFMYANAVAVSFKLYLSC